MLLPLTGWHRQQIQDRGSTFSCRRGCCRDSGYVDLRRRKKDIDDSPSCLSRQHNRHYSPHHPGLRPCPEAMILYQRRQKHCGLVCGLQTLNRKNLGFIEEYLVVTMFTLAGSLFLEDVFWKMQVNRLDDALPTYTVGSDLEQHSLWTARARQPWKNMDKAFLASFPSTIALRSRSNVAD